MTLSLATVAAARIALSEKMLREPNDPRWRQAYNELRQVMFAETTQSIIEASHVPAMTRLQAG